MGLDIEYIYGQTPLDDEEKEGLLIKSITSRIELDEFEQQNIEKAIEWTMRKKINSNHILDESFIRELHKHMFDDVWAWAGSFRKSDKNIGVDWHQIPLQLRQLIGDCKFWIENKAFCDEEIAIQFKHRIVKIHCFANGNGRHSRLMADLIMRNIFHIAEFSWGNTNLVKQSEARRNYINAIIAADGGNIEPLINFAKS